MDEAEAAFEGRFLFDLPASEAAVALSGYEQKNLHTLGALTGASLVMRGLQIEIKGRSPQVERASALIELGAPI